VSGSFVVEPLGDAHDRRSFSCGVEPLDRYFRERVTQDIRRRVTNCFVALDQSGSVAGYYTFAASSLPVTELLPDEIRRLPRYPLLPAGLIGRLAVALRCARQGLGAALIVDAVSRAMRAEPAIFALIVDAKDDAAQEFYEHHGFRPFLSRPTSLFLPISEAAKRLTGSR
jgi:ribosomal protein S18 acetylase RimI-like enzyme